MSMTDMTTQNLLVELFVEELPPKALRQLGEAFATTLAAQLQAQGLTAADSRHALRQPAPPGGQYHVAERPPPVQLADAVSVSLDAQGQATPARSKAAGAGAEPDGADSSASRTARRGAVLDSVVTGATLDSGAEGAGRPSRACRSPRS